MSTSAKFLVLLGTDSRALLFDCDQHLLGEVIEDDGFIVDRLLLGAIACNMSLAGSLDAVAGATEARPARCYELCSARDPQALASAPRQAAAY